MVCPTDLSAGHFFDIGIGGYEPLSQHHLIELTIAT
jgi:hypothetical protein